MTYQFKAAAAIAAVTIALNGASIGAQSAQDLFQKALAAERADGNLQRAVELYEQIVKQFEKTDRAMVARALVHLGQAYERLGSAEAKKRYERVTREFSDQAEPVRMARMRLSALRLDAAVSAPTHRQVWTIPSSTWVTSASHDGQYVTYVDWNTGNLFLRDLKAGSNRQLTTDGRFIPPGEIQWAEQAVLSRDNTHVAYNWYLKDRYELRIVDVRESSVTQARILYRREDVDWIAPFDWSPDGTRIAVALSRADRTSQIAVLSVRDGSLKALKSFADLQNLGSLAISPDGRYLAFDAPGADGVSRDLFVVAADGSREIRIAPHNGDDALMGWSPDGAGIVFASDRGGSANLWLQRFDGTASLGAPIVVRREIGNASAIGVTRNGGLYSVVRPGEPGRLSIASLDLANGVVTSPPAEAFADAPGSQGGAEWSADGKHLAYVSRRDLVGGRQRTVVATRSLDTGLTREFRLDLTQARNPMFSRDGQRLLVPGGTRALKTAVYVVDLSTGAQTAVAVAGPWEMLWGPAVETTGPSWGGDGRRVYYRRITKDGFRLFEYDLDARTERELFSGPDPGAASTVSPDGRKVYYRRLLGPSNQPADMQEAAFVERDLTTGADREVIRRLSMGAIWLSPDGRYIVTGSTEPSGKSRAMLLISVEDGRTRELLRAPRSSGTMPPIAPIVWAPDGRSILIRRMPPGPERVEVWWAPVDDRPARQLFTLATLGRARIHPDGQRLVFSGAEAPTGPSELWLLEGFLPSQPTRPDRARPAPKVPSSRD